MWPRSRPMQGVATNEEHRLIVAGIPWVLGNDTGTRYPLDAHPIGDRAGPWHARPLTAEGVFTYIPAADYHGPDSFTYKVNDGSAAEYGHRLDHRDRGQRHQPSNNRSANPASINENGSTTVSGSFSRIRMSGQAHGHHQLERWHLA